MDKIILRELINNKSYARQVIPYLESKYFYEIDDSTIFKHIKLIVDNYSTDSLSLESIGVSVENDNSINESTYKAVVESLCDIEGDNTSAELNWLLEHTDNFIKDKSIRLAVMDAINIIDDDNKPTSQLPELLQTAMAKSIYTEVGHDWREDVEARFDYYNNPEEKYPLGLEELNKATNGGVTKKTLNLIAAGINTGKSLFLTSMASHFIKHYKVLYISLEMSQERIAERIDANLMRIPLNNLYKMNKDQYLELYRKSISSLKGGLVIKEYPTGCGSVNDFNSLLEELRIKKNFIPEIIMVDYLGIMASTRYKSGTENSYQYVKAISEELRGFAIKHNLPVFSATQINRSAMQSDDQAKMTDVAESIGLAMTADLIISMQSSESLRDEGKIKLGIIKNRFGDFKKSFDVDINYPEMRISDSDDVAVLNNISNNHLTKFRGRG
jgi:replicative DNA helicase